MNKKIILSSTLAILLSLPVVSLGLVIPAPPGLLGGNLTGLASTVASVVTNILWTISVAFVIIMFVLAGFKYATAQSDSTKVSEATRAVVWGLAGTVVIILAYSIVSFVKNQLGI